MKRSDRKEQQLKGDEAIRNIRARKIGIATDMPDFNRESRRRDSKTAVRTELRAIKKTSLVKIARRTR